jgi:hypothetical protein
MAPCNALQAKPQPPRRPVSLNRLETILRTTWLKPAPTPSPAERVEQRRNRPPVNSDQENKYGAHLTKTISRVSRSDGQRTTFMRSADIVSALSRSSRAGQNRKPPGENQPFLSHFRKTCPRRRWFRNHHDQKSRGEQTAMQAANLAQSASHTVAVHGFTNPPRSHQSKSRPATRGISRNTQTQPPSLHRAPLRAHQGKLPAESDPRRTRESKPLRPRCAGRRGFRHPWAAAVCDRAGGGG